MVPKVYLAAHQLRVETIFKGCSNYLIKQLNENNCLSMSFILFIEIILKIYIYIIRYTFNGNG